MKNLIAYCGLDCGKCDARTATLNNDDALRQRVAEEWSGMNQTEIKPEHINCVGCRVDGIKTYYCSDLCAIRKCAAVKNLHTCGNCADMDKCETLGMLTANNAEVAENLKQLRESEQAGDEAEGTTAGMMLLGIL